MPGYEQRVGQRQQDFVGAAGGLGCRDYSLALLKLLEGEAELPKTLIEGVHVVLQLLLDLYDLLWGEAIQRYLVLLFLHLLVLI